MGKFTTMLGVLISIGLVGWSIMSSGDVKAYIDLPSIAVVLGGTIGTTLMVFSLAKLKNLIGIFKIAFFKSDSDRVEELYQILYFSTLARKSGGILGISADIENLEDPFLKKGFNLVADNVDPDTIKSIMTREIESTAQRHMDGQDILGFMSEASPAFGMIGTLIGLVGMLGSLDDPASIGPKMAVALLTTLYGAFLANVLFIPLAKKLEKISEDEISIKEGLLDGILAFQAGETTLIIEERLKSFLNNSLKNSLEERKEGANNAA